MSSATPLTIMVTDQSPEWTFFPSSEGSSNTTWQSAWTGTPDSAYDPRHKANNIPSGSSSHVTTFSGASAQIEFVGTRVSVFGQGTAGAYTTTLDDGAPVAGAPSGSVLATYKDLDAHAKHTLLLKANGTQPLALSYASIDLWPDVGPASVVNTTQVAVSIQGDGSAQTNSFYSTSGSGFSNQHNQDQGGYTRLDTNAAGASISFTCTNSSAVFIYGTTNYNHGNLSVEINPAVGSSSGPRVLSGTSKWFVLDNLIYWESGLDPSTSYRVTLTNLNDGNYSDIHSVVLMNVQNTTSTSSVSVSPSSTSSSFQTSPSAIKPQHVDRHDGKIAGITVGAVLGAIALLLAAFVCLRRRYRRKPRLRSTTSSDGLVITPYKHTPRELPLARSQSQGMPKLSTRKLHDAGSPAEFQRPTSQFQ
ncbi:unnamed protein product [Mycena citricolor]|uniref:Transmembrane protein n=1 Tax=Mycena citricolor TaxID=2018698 RepID=A0AAD2Q0L0_9AGAR|nr:unnamed protein product [Mycena citricolor]